MLKSLAGNLIDELYELTQSLFSESVTYQAKKCMIDYIGATLAGSKMLKDKGSKILEFNYFDQGNTIVIGFNRKTTVHNAVLLNGLSSHVAELDDGHRFGLVHPGAPIISALISIAENEKINGKDFLKSIIIGYEAAVLVGMAIQPSHKQLGYHGTGTCGTIGAAIGIAAALGFTKTQMKDALSASATAASGFLAVIDDGSELKPFNVGRAALNGLVAANMARAGFAGPNDILGGKRGFLSVMSNQGDYSCLARTLEDPFAIEKVYMKPYVGCRHCHPAVEATLNIRTRHGIRAKDVKSVEVRTYGFAVDGHDHTLIQGVSSAKMSIPYSVAVALEFGKAGINEFTEEHTAESQLSELTNKVQVVADDELSALVPQKRAAIVEIVTHEGCCYSDRVDYPKGEPENPLSESELEDKFVSLALFAGKTREEAAAILKVVWNLEDELDNLYALLR